MYLKRPNTAGVSLSLLLSQAPLFSHSAQLRPMSTRHVQIRANHVLIFRRNPAKFADQLPVSYAKLCSPSRLSPTTVALSSYKFTFRTADIADLFFRIAVIQQPPPPPSQRYKLQRTLGAGATSIVYSAVRDDGLNVAIKAMPKLDILSSDTKTDRLLKERQTLSTVSRTNSPFLLRAFEVAESLSSFLFVTERASTDLSRLVHARAPLKTVFAQMVLAIRDLHQLHISHGDVKLENFVVSREGVIKLCDFGLSGGGVGMRGTRRYMAPECLRGEGGVQADVWALGVCWFVLSCGRWPFGGARDAARLFREIREMEPLWETVRDERLRHLLQNMLTKNEWDRFDVVQVMKHEWFADVDWETMRADAKVHGFEELVEVMRAAGVLTDDEEQQDVVAENAVSDVSAEEVFDGGSSGAGASKKAWSVAEVRRRLSGERAACGALGATAELESIAAFSTLLSTQ